MTDIAATLSGSIRRPASLLVIGCALVVLAAVPFILTTMPPVMDYPNHLTRFWLLTGGAKMAPLSAIYDVRWNQTSTNVLVDLFAVAAAHALPLATVGKALLLVMFLAPPLAAVTLNRALFGGFNPWHLAAFALVWSTTAVTGLISFQIGLAAALFAAAALRDRIEHLSPARLATIAIAAAALLFVHPFATLFFLTLLTALRLGPQVPRLLSPAWVWPHARGILLIACACFVPVALMLLLSPHPPGAHGTHHEIMHWEPMRTVLNPVNLALVWMSPFLAYKAVLDAVLVLPVYAVVAWAAWRGALKVHAGLLAVASPLWFVSPLLPMNVGDGGAFIIRFPILAALMTFAGLSLQFKQARVNAALVTALSVAALVRIATIGWIWHERAHDVDDLRAATEDLPAGASVLVLQQKWNELRGAPIGRLVAAFPGSRCASERHFASLTVIWRHVFVPTLFTVPGQQPLAVKPPWKSKSVYSSGIPFVEDMQTPLAQEFDPYLVDWRKKFGYVILLDADFGTPVLPGTRLMADHGFARTYRVVR